MLKDEDDEIEEMEAAGGNSVMVSKSKPTTYNVMIKTGNKWFAGTRARAFIQFGDVNGNKVNSFLKKRAGLRRFKAHGIDLFQIETNAQ